MNMKLFRGWRTLIVFGSVFLTALVSALAGVDWGEKFGPFAEQIIMAFLAALGIALRLDTHHSVGAPGVPEK